MADYNYILYDSLVTGTAVFDTLLFQVAQGADATHTEVFTNMRGAGSLPSTEKFSIHYICALIPPSITSADLANLFVGSLLQFRLLNQILVWVPLQAMISYSGFNSFFTLAAAANAQVSGYLADNFRLETPITINGGEKFDVRVKSTIATVATYTIVIGLVGVLSLP